MLELPPGWIATDVAFVVVQLKVDGCPALIVAGVAVNWIVGTGVTDWLGAGLPETAFPPQPSVVAAKNAKTNHQTRVTLNRPISEPRR